MDTSTLRHPVLIGFGDDVIAKIVNSAEGLADRGHGVVILRARKS